MRDGGTTTPTFSHPDAGPEVPGRAPFPPPASSAGIATGLNLGVATNRRGGDTVTALDAIGMLNSHDAEAEPQQIIDEFETP